MSNGSLRMMQLVMFALLAGGTAARIPADTALEAEGAPSGAPAAFPTACGFGAATAGGRGGEVLEVTTLADTGPGSLREAVSREGPRIVLFRIGGLIELSRPISILHPYLTIAGQTAPGGGICLKGAGLDIRTHDVVVRHLRVRPGNPAAGYAPAIAVSGGYNILFDHVSAGWGAGSTVQIGCAEQTPPHDITFQWCFFTETLRSSSQAAGPAGRGFDVQAGTRNLTLHHNLFAHNEDGNPRLQGAGRVDFVSNLVYNWGLYSAGAEVAGGTEQLSLNLVQNYFRRGLDSIGAFFYPAGRSPEEPVAKVYIAGNRGNDDSLFQFNNEPELFYRAFPFLTDSPAFPPSARADNADWAFELVLARAGALLPARDSLDTRLAGEVRRRKGRIIGSPEEVGGWPVYPAGVPPADADRDGMPDAWERQKGLDPQDPADGALDADGDGYPNLEEYLNALAGDM